MQQQLGNRTFYAARDEPNNSRMNQSVSTQPKGPTRNVLLTTREHRLERVAVLAFRHYIRLQRKVSNCMTNQELK